MENVLKKNLVIALVFYTVICNASVIKPVIEVNKAENQSIVLTLQNFQEQVEVYIKDKNGFVLHKDKCLKSSSIKKYKLSLLPEGEYFIEIQSVYKTKFIPFNVSLDNVEILRDKEREIFNPLFKIKDNVIFIYKLAINYEALKILIYDEESNLIYKEVLKGKQVLEKKLNTTQLKKGEYTLVMKSEGKTYTENIRI